MNFFDSLEPHEIAQNIKEIVRCPFCGSDYQEKYIKILGKMEGNYIIQLFCVECRNNIMANFSYKNNRGIIKQDNKMDVKMGEMIRFAQKGLMVILKNFLRNQKTKILIIHNFTLRVTTRSETYLAKRNNHLFRREVERRGGIIHYSKL